MRVPAVAMVLAVLTMSAMADDVPSATGPIDTQTNIVKTVPFKKSLTFGGDSVLVVTTEGVVQDHDGKPIDELPPAQQIEVLCAAISRLAVAYVDVEVIRCGKP